MALQAHEVGLERRHFLRAAVATAVAAAATGGGAALLLSEKEQAALPAPPPASAPIQIANSAATDAKVEDLLVRLAAAQAENIRLQADLGAAQRQLETAQTNTLQQQQASESAWQSQVEEATKRAESLAGQVSLLGGLVALYERLDAVDLAQVVDGGLTTVGDLLSELSDRLPSLTEGLQLGQQALSEFEEQIPLVDEGRRWLAEQIESLGVLHGVLELAVQNAVDTTGGFLQLLNEWFQDILRWLPFGLGKKAEAIMSAMGDLLDETPRTVSGVRQKVSQPLDLWLLKEGEEPRVKGRLIKPVREQVLNRAADTVGQVEALQTTYQADLVGPVQAAAEQRRAIRDSIAQYRQTYQI